MNVWIFSKILFLRSDIANSTENPSFNFLLGYKVRILMSVIKGINWLSFAAISNEYQSSKLNEVKMWFWEDHIPTVS